MRTSLQALPKLGRPQYADLLDHGPYGDFRDALVEDGYVVVPNVMTAERAAEIRSKAFGWLESFGRGFDRTKPETFGQAFLPQYGRGGMYPAYGIHHEQWVWDCRLEPGVRATFAKLWGTDKLVTSFDGGAIMMPFQPPMTAGDSSVSRPDRTRPDPPRARSRFGKPRRLHPLAPPPPLRSGTTST